VVFKTVLKNNKKLKYINIVNFSKMVKVINMTKVVIGAEVNVEIAKKIELLAKYNQCSKSAIVRKALIIGLKKVEEQTKEIMRITQSIKG